MDLVVKRNLYSATRSVSAKPSNRSPEKRLSMTDRPDLNSINSFELEFQQKRSLLDLRSLRTFSKDDEYIEAMVEDLCDWLNFLYELRDDCGMNPTTFFQQIADGVILNRHATVVHSLAENYLQTSRSNSRVLPIRVGSQSIKVPKAPPTWVEVDFSKKINDFHRRDNVANFIEWCRGFNIPIGMTFETEDLISQKNLRNVIVCLMEIARIGRLFGMEVPDIIQLEEDIDKEVSGAIICTSEIESVPCPETTCSSNDDEIDTSKVALTNIPDLTHITIRKKTNLPRIFSNENNLLDMKQPDLLDVAESVRRSYQRYSADQFDCTKVDNSDSDSLNSHSSTYKIPNYRTVKPVGRVKIYDCFDKKNLVRDRKYREKCDMRSLDERVREILSECQCSELFPMKRISEGRYQWGDKKTHIFVRILRNHVMVRVGGGWDTLNNFLRKHDHCRKDRNVCTQRPFVAPPIRKLLKPNLPISNDLKSDISQRNCFEIGTTVNSNRCSILMMPQYPKQRNQITSNGLETTVLVPQGVILSSKLESKALEKFEKKSENKENSCFDQNHEQTFPLDKNFSLSENVKNSFIPENRPLIYQPEKNFMGHGVIEAFSEVQKKEPDHFINLSDNESVKTSSNKIKVPVDREYPIPYGSDNLKHIEDIELLKEQDDVQPQSNQKLNKILSRIPVLKKR